MWGFLRDWLCNGRGVCGRCEREGTGVEHLLQRARQVLHRARRVAVGADAERVRVLQRQQVGAVLADDFMIGRIAPPAFAVRLVQAFRVP